MSYCEAMEKAGATVLVYEEFGSYQGDWWAKVKYNGVVGWVHGFYGSCSGCDSFQGEFDYSSHYHGDQYIWGDSDSWTPDTCEKCADLVARMVLFGKVYLDDMLSQDEALKMASQHIEWDSDAPAMVAFIEAHADTMDVVGYSNE